KMTDKERLEEIKEILKCPGEVFFGSISEDGVVSQDVADAEPYFKWLIERAEKNMTCQEVLDLQKDALKGILEQNKRYREVLELIADKRDVDFGNDYTNKVYNHSRNIARKALEEESE